MDKRIQEDMQSSMEEWADIQEQKYKLEQREKERKKKDQQIISRYCASSTKADIFRTLELLLKFGGLPRHDEEIANNFKEAYPKDLTLAKIAEFEDMKMIYKKQLESGGEYDD